MTLGLFRWSSALITLLFCSHLAIASEYSKTLLCQDSDEYLPTSPWGEEFAQSLRPDGSKIRGFSEALALRRLSHRSEDQALSEYWLSKMLYSSGLVHLAERGFSSVILRPSNPQVNRFQWAALSCLLAIHRQYPAIPIQKQIIPKILRFHETVRNEPKELMNLLWQAALMIQLQEIALTEQEFGQLQSLLKKAGPSETLSLALQALKQGDSLTAFTHFQVFFHGDTERRDRSLAAADPISADFFQHHIDSLFLLAARAAFENKNYIEALDYYHQIGLRSNLRIQAISEMGWTYLRLEKYREAIGASLSLQTGAMRQTFAPEAPMTMAIALNEICRFPESMGAIQAFKNHYRDAYLWLSSTLNSQTPSPHSLSDEETYHEVISFAKKLKGTKIPVQIGSEWIRSPNFIIHQERLNLLLQEQHQKDIFSQKGKEEQKAKTKELLIKAKKLRFYLKEMDIEIKSHGKINERTRSDFSKSFQLFSQDLIHLKRLKIAADHWRKFKTQDDLLAQSIRKSSIQAITQTVLKLNRRMLTQLNEIAENNDLIEVEILNGASQDLIWQNAHPNFRQVTERMKSKSRSSESATVWNWGNTRIAPGESNEIWEDEIGSLSADISDQCENREKYLQVQAKEEP